MKKTAEFKQFCKQVVDGVTCRGIDDAIIRSFAMTAIQAGIEGKKLSCLGPSVQTSWPSSIPSTTQLATCASFGIFDQP